MEEEEAKPNRRNGEAGVLRGRDDEIQGRGSSTRRSLAASSAADATAAAVRGGTPDPAAGGKAAAAAAVVAGTGAAAAEDHCTSLSLDCGESGGEREKLDIAEERGKP